MKKPLRPSFCFAIVLLVWATATGAAGEEYPAPVRAVCAWVVDGDTIKCKIDGKMESIRLIGINTPERGEKGYREARDFVVELCHAKEVRIEFDRKQRDRYKRMLGYIFVEGEDGKDVNVNVELLRAGHALYYGYQATQRYGEIMKTAFCK